jgi:hypothetical protein
MMFIVPMHGCGTPKQKGDVAVVGGCGTVLTRCEALMVGREFPR